MQEVQEGLLEVQEEVLELLEVQEVQRRWWWGTCMMVGSDCLATRPRQELSVATSLQASTSRPTWRRWRWRRRSRGEEEQEEEQE